MKKKTAKTQAQRDEKYRQDQLDSGLVQIKVWVPANKRSEAVEFCRRLRQR